MNISDACIVMNERVISKAFAKINLTLDVLGKRADGYHDIETVMQSVSLFDLVIIDKTAAKGIRITTNIRSLPCNEKNIAYKAAALFFEETGAPGGVKMLFHKNIPIGAGLAGGSADGAAVLVSMNRLFGNPLSDERLLELGARIGADVPFCIRCGAAVARGIGEKLSPAPHMPGIPLLIVKPKISISTAEMYEALDDVIITKRPDTGRMLEALRSAAAENVAAELCNVMEPPACEKYPVIGEIKKKMLSCGALGAAMTGSGSAVFGIFASKRSADAAVSHFSGDFKNIYSVTTI
ncbi:MAG: 4-(cytidine 5'-diphospho)-2-C-methyl-D-erythritol kinase [Clostridia bacterium]|nr:4-(cytidine 5'-diphospho)-2-C-methyl-D-erythritol kinase [Clostridia bacterium]